MLNTKGKQIFLSKVEMSQFLPITKSEMKRRGWDSLDVILVTGDAYVDHPSFGVAVIGRLLESEGLRVGIISQPDFRDADSFKVLGRPNLFFGVTAGNVDSIVANYTHNLRRRRFDDYSPGGRQGLRPDRATIVYSNKIREAYRETIIVIGGIEASLRRFAHYDFLDNEVRRSIIFDSRADILVYGMAERQILEIARRIASKKPLYGIRGTAVIMRREEFEKLKWNDTLHSNFKFLPSYEEVRSDREKFNEAFRIIYANQDPNSAKTLIQPHGDRLLVVYPPQFPLSTEELDKVHSLPFRRTWHPIYEREGGVPALSTVKFSIISHRGCPGDCSFCAISLHQGRIVVSRSPRSIVDEAKLISQSTEFRGTISDVGGPTANLCYASCKLWSRSGHCGKKSCLYPERCENLKVDYARMLALLRDLRGLPKVRHVFIQSGFRFDLFLDELGKRFLREILENHISGQIKIAPEHVSDKVLRLMNKPPFERYQEFVRNFKEIRGELDKKLYIVNYFISSHPGSTLEDEIELFEYLFFNRIHPEQVQDFFPSPMTLSSCMFYTSSHPITGERLYVPKSKDERRMRRALLQYYKPENVKLVEEALKIAKRRDLIERYKRYSAKILACAG